MILLLLALLIPSRAVHGSQRRRDHRCSGADQSV